MMMEWGMLFAISAAAGWGATGCIRFTVLRTGVLDRPNVRSSHTRPTPTLGGIGMMAGMWAALGVGYGLLELPLPPGWRALAGSTLILLLFAYDEVRPMGRLSKLAVQLGAALLLVVVGGVVMRRVFLPGVGEIALGRAAYPVSLLWLVGLQNLYNFMDGIDGIAALEGVLVAGLLGGLAVGLAPHLAPVPVALTGAALGLLFWNFPPAKIFMGDAGAHFLGLAFGALAVLGAGEGIPPGVTALCLGAFLFDSVYTIFRRLFRGENITLAHRFHLYQRLSAMGWSHRRVDALFGICTLLLGGAGYMYVYGYPNLALGVGCGTAVLMVCGTVWVERRWQRAGGSRG